MNPAPAVPTTSETGARGSSYRCSGAPDENAGAALAPKYVDRFKSRAGNRIVGVRVSVLSPMRRARKWRWYAWLWPATYTSTPIATNSGRPSFLQRQRDAHAAGVARTSSCHVRSCRPFVSRKFESHQNGPVRYSLPTTNGVLERSSFASESADSRNAYCDRAFLETHLGVHGYDAERTEGHVNHPPPGTTAFC